MEQTLEKKNGPEHKFFFPHEKYEVREKNNNFKIYFNRKKMIFHKLFYKEECYDYTAIIMIC